MSGYCCNRLGQAQWRGDATIRVRGPAIAIDVHDADYASTIRKRCEKQRLLVADEGTAVVLLPPLTMGRPLVEEAFDILETCIH